MAKIVLVDIVGSVVDIESFNNLRPDTRFHQRVSLQIGSYEQKRESKCEERDWIRNGKHTIPPMPLKNSRILRGSSIVVLDFFNAKP